ncbi:hypothetical protein FCV25MIE_19466 [Fagus crenata]
MIDLQGVYFKYLSAPINESHTTSRNLLTQLEHRASHTHRLPPRLLNKLLTVWVGGPFFFKAPYKLLSSTSASTCNCGDHEGQVI